MPELQRCCELWSEGSKQEGRQCFSPPANCHLHCSQPALLLDFSFLCLFKINFLELYGSLPHHEGFENRVLAQTVVLPGCMLVAAVAAVGPQLALLAGTPSPR